MSGEPILIVEDNEVNVKLFRVLLQKGGFEFRVAGNAREALTVLGEFSPRLILMDVQLPGMDGLELTRRLKADRRYRDIVIVALTSYAMKGDEQRACDAGCDGYIPKPIDTRTFTDEVRRFLTAAPVSAGKQPERQRILIADDDAPQRRLLEIHLTQLGFDVMTAKDGAEALDTVRAQRTDVVVTDILMPRLDGFRLAQSIRQDPALANLPVVLMTSGALRPDDEHMACDFGANAVVARTEGFDQIVAAIRTALVTGAPAPAKLNEDFSDLRGTFIADALRDLRSFLDGSGSASTVEPLKRLAHRWAGTGGTLGLPQVSQTAFEIERSLRQNGVADTTVFSKLSELHDLFLAASMAQPPTLPGPIATALEGRRYGAVGFNEVETSRLAEALKETHGVVQTVCTQRNAEDCESCDVVLMNVTEEKDALQASVVARITRPLVAIGLSTAALEATLNAHRGAHDFLLRPWNDRELSVRCYAVLRRSSESTRPHPEQPADSKVKVLIGEDDPTTVALLQKTLTNYALDCRAVSSGGEVLEAVAHCRPDLLVLDVNMPQLDGFEVLSTLKNNAATRGIPVVLLTARQQEADILRGFSLGAEDYVTKPFSPMELVARIKRTLRKTS